MADIYRNSYLTLAAARSADGARGLFFKKETFLETEIEVVVRQDLSHMRDLGDKETQQFPLLTRAWSYQERMLAPRIAHFCEDELIWECCEM